ncbi:MAG: glutamate formimidoyltransferase [Bryobacterales bacterium]|nr:glutamate formimidoyltransferase [Bryobacterales bacterium]
MDGKLIECVPNFSEGRERAKVEAIVQAIASAAGVHLLAWECDADHNRSVVTFAGAPSAVLEGAFRGVGKAAELIDIRAHHGVHPRIGAADVVPLIPLEGVTLAECAALAHSLGSRIATELGVPVYFYEAAARRPERRNLENIRRGGWEALRHAATHEASRMPDAGGPQLHPTAGATAVGARKFLLAFNVNLATDDVEAARKIARKIRASSGGLPHVKAMGVFLQSRGQAQVSMNLTDFEVTPLHTVFEAVRREAEAAGVPIAGSEIIGLMPAEALAQAAAHFLHCENYRPGLVLEKRLLSNLID